MRAVGDAGPYGGIDESASVFEGAPMRAVGNAGPYGVRDRRHGEIRVGGVCPLGRSNAGRGSGSGDRSAGDSVRNLFAPLLQLDEREIQKPSVFGGVLFHISFAVERNMAAGGKCRTRVQPAIRERKTGRRGRRPLRGARPETWRDTCGRGVPIGAFKRGTRERQRG